eukprot:1339100-Pyramimonas_sp.AAC.1
MVTTARAPGERCDRQRAFVAKALSKLERAREAVDKAQARLQGAGAKCTQREKEHGRAKMLLDQLEAMQPIPAA